MALESDHCENSEINCTIEAFNSERATISFYEQTPNEVLPETLLRTGGAQMNVIASSCAKMN